MRNVVTCLIVAASVFVSSPTVIGAVVGDAWIDEIRFLDALPPDPPSSLPRYEPDPPASKPIFLEVDASTTVFWDTLSHVEVVAAGPEGIYRDNSECEALGRIGGDASAGFRVNFHLLSTDFEGDYTLTVTPYIDWLTPGQSATTEFYYAGREFGLGRGEYESNVTFTLTDGGEVDISGGTIENAGNLPTDIQLSAEPFLDSGGGVFPFDMSFQTQAGTWSTLDGSARDWGTIPVLGSASPLVRVMVPDGTALGVYTTALTIAVPGGGSGSSAELPDGIFLNNAPAGDSIEIPITLSIVPEPATISLVLMGALGLITRRKQNHH